MSANTPLKDLAALAENAGNAANLLKAMGNQNRLMILCTLAEQELSVSALNQHIPLSQSALSQHLAALRQAGLVQKRRDGQTLYYCIHGTAALEIIAVLKKRFCPEDTQ